MKKYRSIKIVEVGKIVDISSGGNMGGRKFHFDDGTTLEGTYEMELRYTAKRGDYIVKYEDGYVSISPAAPFEAGYVPLEKA